MLVRRSTAGRAAAARAPAGDPRARGLAAAARRAAGRAGRVLPARARHAPRRLNRSSWSTRPSASTPASASRRPTEVRELADVDPERMARAGPHARSELRERDDGEALVLDAVAHRGRRGARRDDVRGLLRVRRARAVPRPARPRRRLAASSARFQAELIERLGPAPRAPHRGRGHRPRLRSKGRTWVNSDGKRNMPSGEVFTGPLESSADGHHPLRRPVRARPGVEVGGVDARVPRRRGRRRHAPTRARSTCRRALATDDGARRLGELGHRHQLRHRPPDRRDPLRREDRRHRPPGARPLLPGDRRQERNRRCTGT